jgi:hypothetical protein
MKQGGTNRSLGSSAGRPPVGSFPLWKIGVLPISVAQSKAKPNNSWNFPFSPSSIYFSNKNREKIGAPAGRRGHEVLLKSQSMSDPTAQSTHAPESHSADRAREALIARLDQLHRKPGGVRPPQSLQPTPEAAKSRVRRLRRKQRLLVQKSAKRSARS